MTSNYPFERRLDRLEAAHGPHGPAFQDAAARQRAATSCALLRRLAHLAAVAGLSADAFRAHLRATRQTPRDTLDTALRDWLVHYLTGCYPPRGPDPIEGSDESEERL